MFVLHGTKGTKPSNYPRVHYLLKMIFLVIFIHFGGEKNVFDEFIENWGIIYEHLSSITL